MILADIIETWPGAFATSVALICLTIMVVKGKS